MGEGRFQEGKYGNGHLGSGNQATWWVCQGQAQRRRTVVKDKQFAFHTFSCCLDLTFISPKSSHPWNPPKYKITVFFFLKPNWTVIYEHINIQMVTHHIDVEILLSGDLVSSFY